MPQKVYGIGGDPESFQKAWRNNAVGTKQLSWRENLECANACLARGMRAGTGWRFSTLPARSLQVKDLSLLQISIDQHSIEFLVPKSISESFEQIPYGPFEHNHKFFF